MSDQPTPITWPKLLTIAEYARACEQVTKKPVSRQSIANRLAAGSLTAEEQTIGGLTRRYINTEKYPPGPSAGRWPNRPPGSVPHPKRAPKTAGHA